MKGGPRVAGRWGIVKVLAIDFRPVFGSLVSMLPVDWEGS